MKTRNLHVYKPAASCRSHCSRAHIRFYVACMATSTTGMASCEHFHFCTPCGESFLWKSQRQRHTASSKHKTVAGRLQLLDELEDDGIDTPPMAIVLKKLPKVLALVSLQDFKRYKATLITSTV